MKTAPQHAPDRPHRRRRRTPALRRLILCAAVSVIGFPVVTHPAASADSGPTPLVSQIANEPISVSAAEFRRHLFVAADAARLSDPSNTADLLAERVLQHMYALNAQTDPAAAAQAVQGLIRAAAGVTGPAFDSRISRTMVLFQQAAAADQGPVAATLQRATTEVVALTAQQISSTAADTHAENALGATGDTESRLLASSTFTPTAVLLDSVTLADADAKFASARDLVWATSTGASITASSAALLANAPRLKGNSDVQALAALRDQAGNLETTGGVIAGAPTNPAPHTIGAVMAQLDTALDTTQHAAAASTGPAPVAPGVAAAAVQDARDSQTTLALQTGFLTGSTTGAKDIVDQVGAAAVQATLLATAFSDFSAGTIGRAALSGNAIGVVMTLLPGVLDAAGIFGPSSEDLIMTQLDNISQQMADFQNAVNGQFALVFDNLGQISNQLDGITQKLDRAIIDIEQARVQIGQMYDSLTKLQGSLDAVQNNILDALRNGTNSQLRETINSALGYQDRNGSPLPLNDFNNAAAFLHTFATVTARHSPELNTDYPTFDVQNDANQLSTGLASNVHFLDRVPAERGWRSGRLSGLSGDAPQLANIDDFVLASRAYAQLMLENPGYVSAGYRRWLSDIQQLGDPLANLTSAISTPDTSAGTHSTLLDHLACARTMAAFAPTTTPACQAQSEDAKPVDALVAQAADQLRDDVPGYDGPGLQTTGLPLTTSGTSTFDPFVNSASDPSDLSDLWPNLKNRATVAQCGAATGETAGTMKAMDRPASLTPDSQGVPQVFQWADRLGLGSLNVCYKTSVRTVTVSACQFGTQWMVVNRLSGECADTFWDPGIGSANVFGALTTVQYQYDDTAFVWTYTPSGPSGAPIYVQSLVRRGSAIGTKPPAASLDHDLPPGGYASGNAPQTYISDTTLVPSNGGTSKIRFELTDVKAAPHYAAPADAAAVRLAWGDATKSTPGVSSFQGTGGAIDANSALDEAVTGLDPKLGSATERFGRPCTTADQTATTSACVLGPNGVPFISQTVATQPVTAAIKAQLVTLQGDVYRKLLSGTQTSGSTTSGPLHDALVRLDGANAMLSSFLQLGASTALRQHDLTDFTAGLGGSQELVAAMKAQRAKTLAGQTAVSPSQLVTQVLDPSATTALDGLLPLPGTLSGMARANGAPVGGSSAQPIVGPVLPALQSTNDQLALTAVALGAPQSAAPVSTTPTATTTAPAPTMGPVKSPDPVVRVAFSNAWVSAATVHRRYKARVAVTGGTASYSWSRQGRLPRGMSGKPTKNGRAYVIEGKPRRAGVFTFTLTVTDTAGGSTSSRYTIRVR